MSYEEIAEATGLSIETVRKTLYVARAKLRDVLERDPAFIRVMQEDKEYNCGTC